MARRVLTADGARGPGSAAGFTLIETVVAMAIGVVVMLANLFLFNTANRNLAASRLLSAATNLAAGKLADFRALTLAEIAAAAPNPAPGPLDLGTGSDTVTAGGIPFARTWVVSGVDLDGDGAADLAGDLVRVRVEVAWTKDGGDHRVAMTTLTTGRSP